jgi:hypothetical protein
MIKIIYFMYRIIKNYQSICNLYKRVPSLHNKNLKNCQNKVVIDSKKKMFIGNPYTVKIQNMIIKKICY